MQLNNDKNTCRDGTYFFGQCAKISLKFTDKEPVFADLSVSKTHFTDKLAFFGQAIYGQTLNFQRFVRKRQ